MQKVIDIDLIGTWRTDKYAALYMRKQGFGRIINISSTSGMYGTPKLATYCMAKWGVRGLTKTLAQELKGTGIVVNTVCPTKVKTPMCETDSYVQFINDLTGKHFAELAGNVRRRPLPGCCRHLGYGLLAGHQPVRR